MPPKAKQLDFFIIGMPKCGTTSLYSWLKEHSNIFMPDAKEPHYFAGNLSNRYCRMRDKKGYLDLFKNAKDNQLCGEASVLYGFYPKSIWAILEFNPKAKIIIMMRHPIDMIVSYHGQLLVNLEEDIKDFESAWNAQEDRSNGNCIPSSSTDIDLLQYGEIGRLGQHLKEVIGIVPKDQLKVILLDDLASNPKKTYENVLDFLEIKNDNRVSFEKENEASAIKYEWLEKLKRSNNPFVKIVKSIIKKLPFLNNIVHMNEARRKDYDFSNDFLNVLYDIFKEDIKYLEKYFGKTLKTKYNFLI